MNENLIPQVIIDLVQKYHESKDVNEKTALEMRLNDTLNYLQVALNVGRSRDSKRNR